MKRISLICVMILALAAVNARAQSFCFQADNQEAWVSISGTDAHFQNCSNPNLPIDELNTTGSLTVTSCVVSYTGAAGAFTLVVNGSSCDGTGTVSLYRGETLIYSFTRTNSQNDSNCKCP